MTGPDKIIWRTNFESRDANGQRVTNWFLLYLCTRDNTLMRKIGKRRYIIIKFLSL